MTSVDKRRIGLWWVHVSKRVVLNEYRIDHGNTKTKSFERFLTSRNTVIFVKFDTSNHL